MDTSFCGPIVWVFVRSVETASVFVIPREGVMFVVHLRWTVVLLEDNVAGPSSWTMIRWVESIVDNRGPKLIDVGSSLKM